MVLITLQFYATGIFQIVVGNVLRYSQPLVCRSITIVSLALAMISKVRLHFQLTFLRRYVIIVFDIIVCLCLLIDFFISIV
jgi:hypothetical protein